MRRGLCASALFVVVGLLVVVVAGPAIPAPAAGEACKLGGVRYSGRTSQGKPVCFTVTRTGKRVSEYAYAFRDSCGAGTLRTTSRSGWPLSANGSFSATGASGSFFKGRLGQSKAGGSFRARRTEYGVVPPVTCDTGVVRWTAHRVG